MKLVDFDFQHLELFDWRDDEYKMYNTGSMLVSALLAAEEKGECYTLMHDGRILGIGGIMRVSQKTGYAFTAMSKWAEQYPFLVARTAKRMFRNMMEDMGLHRITTYNLLTADKHHKWCEWLGFEQEGLVKKYDDAGRDYVQYGMVL